ncbi:MAG: hypothetical protein GVY20_13900 [Bacteroidetes bacterium]|jgi:hypothetical protein|nr:hypothetical protein [Bacteroidota bacterium]
MKAFIPISVKRLITKQMAEVQAGRCTLDEGIETIHKARLSREQIVEQLTRNYDPEAVEAFQFFRII